MDLEKSRRISMWRYGLSLSFLCTAVLGSLGCAVNPEESADTTRVIDQQLFETPEEAAEALVVASERFDTDALTKILGSEGVELVLTEDRVLDENQSKAFAEQAREGMHVDLDPDDPRVAILSVGVGDWPVPIPIVEESGAWRFDTEAGREEILIRRIGRNELDAIAVCEGYVEAQHEYALEKHGDSRVNQYAQRIVSTPNTRDGLAWRDADGVWRGPVGEAVARAIEQGYETKEPFHGYLFKVLKGQGPAAPMGEMDFVVDGAMIGGFALAAAPADYEVTGVMSFMVSHDGVVYEKDLGPDTREEFRDLERFNPDSSWEPVSTDE